MKLQNPFTTTFSKTPDYTYIDTLESADIIENFSYPSPTESVFKIVGLRGSGKTVILSRIQQEFSNRNKNNDDWLVYNLNPSRNMLQQLAAFIIKEPFVKKNAKSKSLNVSASILGTGGGVGYSYSQDDNFFDIGVELKKMLEIVSSNKKKVMICVDEVSKTQEMIVFSLEFAGWLISGFPVYFVCTGLFENVRELGNAKNLTFFRRGKTVETKPLNYIRMVEMYKSKLDIDSDIAKKLATITKGYAYAFQTLGSLYFDKGKDKSLDELVSDLKAELFSYSYEKIWEELSYEERFMVSLIVDKEEYKREEILGLMSEKKSNYSVYRDRLKKKGVITTRQGYISLNPPFFGDYVKEYCMI